MTGRRPVAERVLEATRSLAAARDTATSDPLAALRHAVDAREEADALVAELAAHARLWHGDRGASWTDIGQALAVTRQAAQQRYGADADQLLRETIRGNRQATLTPGTPGGEANPRKEPAVSKAPDPGTDEGTEGQPVTLPRTMAEHRRILAELLRD